MDENMKNRIVPATEREVNIDADYMRWIADVKTRYRQNYNYLIVREIQISHKL